MFSNRFVPSTQNSTQTVTWAREQYFNQPLVTKTHMAMNAESSASPQKQTPLYFLVTNTNISYNALAELSTTAHYSSNHIPS